MSGTASPRRRDLVTPALLVLLVMLLSLFSAYAVPRLINNAIGDIEFTGWSGPIAKQVLGSRAPYSESVAPIPPGSLLLVGAIHQLSGAPRLLDELGLIAVCHILLAALGYAMVRPLTSRENSVLVAIATSVILLRGIKECAYDQTAAVVAWSSVAFGARALTLELGRRRDLAWAAAGVLAMATLYFKQSTAFGALAGWPLVFAYLAIQARDSRAAVARAAQHWALGAALGAGLVAVGLWAMGASVPAFLQAAITDGPSLKGGSRSMRSLVGFFLLASPVYPASLVLTSLCGAVLVRMARRPQGLCLGGHDADAPWTRTRAVTIAALAIAAFGTATWLIAARVPRLPEGIAFWTERLRFVPGFGVMFVCVLGVAHLSRAGEGAGQHRERAQAWNALALITLCISFAHNLSSTELRLFYDPNPIIPIAFAFLFAAFDLAALPRAKLCVFALAVASLFSSRLDRALAAQFPIGRHGNWGGLYVQEGALPIVQAAERVHALTGEQDTVLVLPEDLQIVGLIQRPRPALRGAVVFVDQYAPRLLAEDLARLERDLPKVVVVRPAERDLWALMFAHWNSNSAARTIVDRFLDDWLPRRYRRDSSYATRFGDRVGTLEVWVHVD